MERTSLIIAAVSAALAGIFIYYSKPLSKKIVSWIRKPVSSFVVLGTIDEQIGQVRVRSGSNSESRNLPTGSMLRHLDTLLVDAESEAILSFKSGYKIKILPNSEITVQSYRPDRAQAPLLISVASGDYQLLARGTAGELFIAARNQIFAPEYRPQVSVRELFGKGDEPSVLQAKATALTTSLGSSHIRIAPKNSETAIGTDNLSVPDKLTIEGREVLSNQYIERTIETQSNAFRRCQLNSVRDNLAAEGSLLFSITIAPSGRIEGLQVMQDLLNNEQLLNCTKSVIERMQFKTFAGEPVTVNYPIEFR